MTTPDLRSIRLNRAVLCAIAQTDPKVATDPGTSVGIEIRNLNFTPSVNLLESGEYTPSLDPGAPAVGAVQGKLDFELLVKGSSAGPGELADWMVLAGFCNWQVTQTDTAIPDDAPEACAAGGTTTTAVLGDTASSEDQIYRGM